MLPILRPAHRSDSAALHQFVNAPIYIHRHLDWRDTLEWLGRQPFYIMEEDGSIAATLACIADPSEVAWVRLFAASMHTSPDRAWNYLFERCLQVLQAGSAESGSPIPHIASLAFRDWYDELLQRKGFIHHQDIVVFLFDQEPPKPPQLDDGITIRELHDQDLNQVAEVDRLAFEPIWRLSLRDLQYALGRSSYCTVAMRGNQLIGYTMSSNTGMYAHLARLAVMPSYRGQGIGFALLQNLLDHFINRLNYWGVTLNTQHDNNASLALYHRTGFRETGERFPVYLYPL